MKPRKPVLAALLLACLLATIGLPAGANLAHAFTIAPLPIVPIVPIIDPVQAANHRTLYTIPLYRLKLDEEPLWWHTYTAFEAERSHLLSSGWVDDGIVAYISPVPVPGTVALHRWTLSGRATWLTTDPTGGNASDIGYTYTGIVGYVVDGTATVMGQVPLYRYQRAGGGLASDLYLDTRSDLFMTIYLNRGATFKGWEHQVALQQITVHAFEPNSLAGGSTVAVSWSTLLNTGYTTVLYSIDGGASWHAIVQHFPNAHGGYSGLYAWTVPNVTADSCYIMVLWSNSVGGLFGMPSAWGTGPKFSITRNLVAPIQLPLLPLDLGNLTLAAPTSLTATAGMGDVPEITLFWEDNSPAETGFSIERRAGSGLFAIVGTVPPDTTSFTDSTVAPGVTYTYRVKATGTGSDSGYSNEANGLYMPPAMTPEPIDPPPTIDEPLLPPLVFDGSQSWWAEEEVTLAYQAGLTYPGIMSQYGRSITREEFCTIVVKLYEKLTGLTALPAINPFTDTNNPEVLKAYALDIVRGVSATQFAPYNNITRQEMCVMIYRALKAAGQDMTPPPAGSFPFTDAGSIAPWAINEVRYCHHHQIMKGTSTTTISPLLNTPREQAIMLLYRAYDNFK